MAIKTTTEQLEEVQTAISKALRGQEVDINGQRIRRPDLQYLYKMQEILKVQLRTETNSAAGSRTTINLYPRRN